MSLRERNPEGREGESKSMISTVFDVERADDGAIILTSATEPPAVVDNDKWVVAPAPVAPVAPIAPGIAQTLVQAPAAARPLDDTRPMEPVVQLAAIAAPPFDESHRAAPLRLRKKEGKQVVSIERTPPNVAPPRGLLDWSIEPRVGSSRRFGSATHPGPPEVAEDKGNQDFAFHLDVVGPGKTRWLLCGVADGAGQGTWSARAAQHAAGGFVEGVMRFLATDDCPKNEQELREDRWSAPLARSIYLAIQQRLEEDASLLKRERFVDPTWDEAEYVRYFFENADAETSIRAKWYQTTLLAAAIGPYGGFALLMGDGFVRVDRWMEGNGWTSSAGLDYTPPITMGLLERQVRASLTRLLPRGARRLGILMTTDGISNSTATALERAFEACPKLEGSEGKPILERIMPSSSNDGMLALTKLAAMPPELTERDNMSLAFGSCDLAPKEKH